MDAEQDGQYCCDMRRYFVIGIVGNRQGDAPLSMVDYVVAWEPKIVIKIKHCPFCGKELDHNEETRVCL